MIMKKHIQKFVKSLFLSETQGMAEPELHPFTLSFTNEQKHLEEIFRFF